MTSHELRGEHSLKLIAWRDADQDIDRCMTLPLNNNLAGSCAGAFVGSSDFFPAPIFQSSV
jgi:hypothetical protein